MPRASTEGRRSEIAATDGEAPSTLDGLVIRTESSFHRVLVGDTVLMCRAPKKLRLGERTNTTMVVIGDRVRVRQNDDTTGIIEEILPRENELVRGQAGGRRFLDVIAANLDLLVVVHSLREPEFVPARLDRFLLIAEAAEIPAVVCLNKVDLASPDELHVAGAYRLADYPVILSSASTGDGVAELREAVAGKISAVVGPSGVGKSTILNRMQPGLQLRTAEISEATGKGRHTTVAAELLPLAGGFVADTPGLRELSIRDVSPQELEWLFPEIRKVLGTCRFSNCTHRSEIGCAVREAMESGSIAPERYRTYVRVFEDIKAAEPY